MFCEDDYELNSFDSAEKKARKAYDMYEDGLIPQAIDELDEALAINPANSSWHFDKGLALDSMNRFEEAIKEYKLALETNPSDVEILNSLAVDYTRTGHYDLAIEMFEQVEKLDNNFEPCYCNRIITYTEMEKHDLAEQMFYIAQHIDPDCALCFYNIGNNMFIRGEYKKAIGCWKRTAELEPTHPQINYRIAQAYWADGDLEQAQKYLLTEMRQNPGDVDIIGDFGLMQLEKGNIESAREKFNRVLEFEPNSAMATFYLGEIAFNNGDYEQAESYYYNALLLDGQTRGARFRMAQCALINKNHERAKSYLTSELQLEVENADVLVSIGSMFLSMNHIDEASHCMLRATDLNMSHGQAYYYLGLCCALRERFEDAADFLRHALDIDGNNVLALRDLAKIYAITNREKEANELLNKAQKILGSEKELAPMKLSLKLSNITERIKNLLKPQKTNSPF